MKTTKQINRHISHIARASGIRASALASRIDAPTISDAIAQIRKKCPSLTIKSAREAYDSAAPAAERYAAERLIGNRRRKSAKGKNPLTIEGRKKHIIRAVLTDLPGERYSGETDWQIIPCERGMAGCSTATARGEQYSKKCTYYKTDATHTIRVSLSDLYAARRAGLPAQIDGWQVVCAKQVRAGIYAVRLLGSVGKTAAAKNAYVADQGDGRWHMARTERGAVTAINRQLRADDASRVDRVNAMVCRQWGWCADGIRQWCGRHNIRRNLISRLRDGARSAAIARLIRKHGGPADAYERRLVMAA